MIYTFGNFVGGLQSGGGSPDTTPDGKQAILIIGDSNAGDTTTGVLGPTTLADTCFLWNGTNLTEITTADISNNLVTDGTPWKKLALDYNAATSKKTVFIQRASGGSEFYPAGDNNNWFTSGDNYGQAQTEVTDCLSFLEITRLKAIFVILGVNDLRAVTTIANIEIGVNSLFLRLTTDYPDVRIYVAMPGRREAAANQEMDARSFAIRKYIRNNVALYDNMILFDDYWQYVPTLDYQVDDLHLEQVGYNKVGEKGARALQSTETDKSVFALQNVFYDDLVMLHKAAYKSLVEGLKSDGNWDQLEDFAILRAATRDNVFVSPKFNSMPLDGGFDFVANNYSKGNGTSTFVRSNFTPSIHIDVASASDFFFLIKTGINNTAVATNGYLFGAFSTGACRLFQTTSSNLQYGCNDTTATAWTGGDTKIQDNTWYAVARLGGTKYLLKNFVVVHSAAVAVGSLPVQDFWIDALNNVGSGTPFLNCEVQAYSIGKYSTANLTNIGGRIDTLLTALTT